MKKNKSLDQNESIFIGIDLHKKSWHVTIRTADIELFSGSIPGTWEHLYNLLHRYPTSNQIAVYEAGYFGFWLHDKLEGHGIKCIVTPPSLIPIEYGNRVKTDRRDSRKLAHFLSKDLLKKIYVPTVKERYHRQVIRRRRQLIGDRVRVQNRIKAELRLNGINFPEPMGKWTDLYFSNLCRIKFPDRFMQESFNRLLEQYKFLDNQVTEQTQLLKELAEKSLYKERVDILCSIPGIGTISAMELLLELQDINRFRRSDQLAAYVGLTPSQYSSADKIRMGRITSIGKNSLRAILVQAAWCLIRKDGVIRERYERIKARSGGKRSIVAIARQLLIRMRRLLLDRSRYVVGLVTSN